MLGKINYEAPFSSYTAVGLIEKMKQNDVQMIIDCGTEDFLFKTKQTNAPVPFRRRCSA